MKIKYSFVKKLNTQVNYIQRTSTLKILRFYVRTWTKFENEKYNFKLTTAPSVEYTHNIKLN